MTHQSSPTIEILFFGDIVGKSGRNAVKYYLKLLQPQENRVVIANAENATHGYGFSKNHYDDLRSAGIHLFTGGNHTWDRKDTASWLPQAEWLLRPANMLQTLPGVGAKVFQIKGLKVGVINLIGQVFMGQYNSPWEALDQHLPALQNETSIIFLDFHAEATAEKTVMAYCAVERHVSAMVGTHTHVQTADNRLLISESGHVMGYLTDAGFNGVADSVIGMQKAVSVSRFMTGLHAHLEVAESKAVQVNAVKFTIDTQTGHCLSTERINQYFDLN